MAAESLAPEDRDAAGGEVRVRPHPGISPAMTPSQGEGLPLCVRWAPYTGSGPHAGPGEVTCVRDESTGRFVASHAETPVNEWIRPRPTHPGRRPRRPRARPPRQTTTPRLRERSEGFSGTSEVVCGSPSETPLRRCSPRESLHRPPAFARRPYRPRQPCSSFGGESACTWHSCTHRNSLIETGSPWSGPRWPGGRSRRRIASRRAAVNRSATSALMLGLTASASMCACQLHRIDGARPRIGREGPRRPNKPVFACTFGTVGGQRHLQRSPTQGVSRCRPVTVEESTHRRNRTVSRRVC